MPTNRELAALLWHVGPWTLAAVLGGAAVGMAAWGLYELAQTARDLVEFLSWLTITTTGAAQ